MVKENYLRIQMKNKFIFPLWPKMFQNQDEPFAPTLMGK